jgi:hypothetical protein
MAMQPHDAQLRDELAVIAAEAAPLTFTAESVVERVRRRRHSVLGATVGSAFLVLIVVAVTSWFAGGPRTSGSVTANASGTPAVGRSAVYMCGDRLALPDIASSRNGLTMEVQAKKSADDGGPSLTVTFTSRSHVHVTSSPPQLFEVLYLRGGVIVGGGPMLNMPGDTRSQGIEPVGHGFDIAPDQPSNQDLGRRNTLCPPLTWANVWSAPELYYVVVLQGQVENLSPQQWVLDVPLPLDGSLLMSRTMFPR